MQEAFETIRCSVLRSGIVHPDDDGRVDVILGRHGENDPAGSGLEVLLERRAVAELARRLDHDVDAELLPWKLQRVPDLHHLGLLPPGDQDIPVHPDLSAEAAHHRVVLQQIREGVLGSDVVDGNDVDVLRSGEHAEDRPSDPSESIHTNLHAHRPAPPSSTSRASRRARRRVSRNPNRCRTRRPSSAGSRPARSWRGNRRSPSASCRSRRSIRSVRSRTR